MKTPLQLQEEQMHELASYQKCYEIHQQLRNDKRFRFTITKHDGIFHAKSDDIVGLSSALTIAENFTPISLIKVGGFKFTPELFATEGMDYQDVAPFWFHVDCIDPHKPITELRWFAMIDAYVVRIECRMHLLHDVNPVRYGYGQDKRILQTSIRFPEWLQNTHRVNCPPAVHHQELGDDFDHFQHITHQKFLPTDGHVFDYFSLHNDLDLVHYLKTLIARKNA